MLGLATALSSVGIEAEAGGSAISKVMIDIASSVGKGGERVERFAKVAGVSADEFTRKWKTDPGAALALFVKGLSDAELQGGSTIGILEELGITEIRMRDALLRSAAASDIFTQAMQTGNEAFRDNNALLEEAAKRYDTTASRISIAKNNVNDAAISFGEVLLPAVLAATDGVSAFAGFMGDLPPPVQGLTSVLAVLAGGVAIFGGTMLLAVPKIVQFREAVATLSTQMPVATGRVKSFASFMGGPWGIAIMAAVAVLGMFSQKTAESNANVDALVDSLDEQTGAFTANSRAIQAKSLLDSGAAETAKRMGISLETLTDAVFGNQEALEAVNRASAEYNNNPFDPEENAWAMDRLRTSMADATQEVERAPEQWRELKKVTDDTTTSTLTAADAYKEAEQATTRLAGELDELISMLNEANGVGQDAITKNNDYQKTLAEAEEQLQKNREGVEGYGIGLDNTTEAGRRNLDMLNDLAQDAWDAADAQHKLDGDTDAYRETLENSRQALIDRAMDFGATAEQARGLADNIFQIPPETEWTFIAEIAAAEAALRRLNGLVSGYQNGKTVSLRAVMNASDTYGMADGGILHFANGGTTKEIHEAQFARAGDYRVWAEPETGGEAYIPLGLNKRTRAEQVLAEVASQFGGAYVPPGARAFADGGMNPPQARQSLTSPERQQNAPVRLDDHSIDKLAQAMAKYRRRDDWTGDA